MRKFGPFLFVLLLVAGCSRSPYPGYKPLGDELYMRLIVLGEGGRTMNDSDRVILTLRAAIGTNASGSLYSTEQAAEAWTLLGSGIAPALRRLHQGDSASLWLPARNVPWDKLGAARAPADTGMVRLDLSLLVLKSAAEVREEEAAYNAWREDRELEERADLERYLSSHGIDRGAAAYQGVYIVPVRKGSEEPLRTGDLVTIAYVAHGLDGTVYDDTYKAGTPLTFRLGDPGQVIRGLEIGLRRMARGGKSILIIPSQFAFGDDGSAAGIVPPFTTVIYDIEVLDKVAEPRP
jgi:FKBP-type peptidyl-prolyl cis-trans isomerase